MGDMPEAQSKASAFNGTIELLRRQLSPETLAELKAALPGDTMRLFEVRPLPMEWIPAIHLRRLLIATHGICFACELGKMRELGRQVMLTNFRGIYRVFIRLASPQFIVDRAAQVWAKHSRHSGTMTARSVDEHTAEVTYIGVAHPSPPHWAFLHGGILAGLEASGAKNVAVRIISGGGRQPDCIVRVTWWQTK